MKVTPRVRLPHTGIAAEDAIPRKPVPMDKERLDILVQRLVGVSRSKARGLIHTGQVYGPDGRKLDKPGMRLDVSTLLEIRDEPRFVSRGGDKLDAAFSAFVFDVSGRVAIDVGASTGGFTDCLLQHGAAYVYAVDVGYGQLAWRLRQDARVCVMERTNIRNVTPDALPSPPEVFTADCSFISLRLVLPVLKTLLKRPAEGVVLVKPQFEAGKALVGKGGVVRDEAVRARVVQEVIEAAVLLGFESLGVAPSPLKGPKGNQEFLAHLRLPALE
ncbi:MAG TPA: TlyA family RNA methyltransferase [Candidatus Hydrogenedentes bacterium]|nr:TlyA family RNA methyltransferase [FCB group bacterium]HNZ18638.1 TlyA family RNA methyltransferase [Candidatus Hydrogenedentota bacterium]HOH34063.1 TlyA family RNA methyltransferase [Candidatus Hydrogenedentota bacterium]HPA02983.1 TlyA family RNA methyltransferase [Candidatus Hydrogenedentota bacterium]HQH68720.1 TlyA family RNA methyltransferase [Candidatus Hydrogenedentota bacterium]